MLQITEDTSLTITGTSSFLMGRFVVCGSFSAIICAVDGIARIFCGLIIV